MTLIAALEAERDEWKRRAEGGEWSLFEAWEACDAAIERVGAQAARIAALEAANDALGDALGEMMGWAHRPRTADDEPAFQECWTDAQAALDRWRAVRREEG
jgi:hypothetical protein